MSQPRLLDLFCGAGGGARGYQMAGFHVTGVDLKPQPRYAGDAFIQGDALEYVRAHGREYDVIHASPPCQGYSEVTPASVKQHYPRLIPAVREALRAAGRPYVIENVPGARTELLTPVLLCGSMFGMRVRRHRYFETTAWLLVPPCDHAGQGTPLSVTGNGYGGKQRGHNGTKPRDVHEARRVMGIDWMTIAELSQALPPAYTHHIGSHLVEQCMG